MTDYSDPCEKVRTSCRRWMEEEPTYWEGQDHGRRSVKIHKEHLPRLANDMLAKKRETKRWIEWDEENWHYSGKGYQGSEESRKERVALSILALDAINFCFWPSRPGDTSTKINSLEYDHLAVALKKMAEADDSAESEESYVFAPKKLASMTPEKMTLLIEPHLAGHHLDNMQKRARLWKEVGQVLLDHFNGSASELLANSDGNASMLVEKMFTFFPGFRDEVDLDGTRIVFLKRAQIFVGDVNAALKLNLKNMEQLTTFADYRVPQILRHFDIIEYSPQLSKTVDSGAEISMGSSDEISIRAATVAAVDDLVALLNTNADNAGGEPFTAVTADWYLWQVGERMHQEGRLKPFHKVKTHFY